MYVRVSVFFLHFRNQRDYDTFVVLSGRPLGTDGAAEAVEGMSYMCQTTVSPRIVWLLYIM